MRVGRGFLALAPLFFSACSASAPGSRSGDRVLIAGAGSSSVSDRQNAIQSNVVYPSPPLIVLPVLRAVYDELGIEVKLFDPGTGEVGNRAFTKMYRLAGEPMNKFVGCGSNAAGKAADSYRINMNIVSRVRADGEGSRVETWLTATAENPGSTGQVACETLGALEARIHDTLEKKLKAAQ